MKFKLVAARTPRDTDKLKKCTTELERLKIIFTSGKPRASHCIDIQMMTDFYAPEIGRYRIYPEGRKGGYRFKTAKEAFDAACEMYKYLIHKIKELEGQQ